MPPEPTIRDFSLWVPWKAERCETPEWWEELSAVLGKRDTRKLAREVRASFGLPWWLQELGSKEATLQAPPAPPCLHRKRFMPPVTSIFACRDIREVPREKMVAYARVLQHWVEWNNLPTGGESHLLARSILELRKEVEWYLATMHRVHQKALAAMATLEEEIERLSCTWAHLKSRARSNSRYCQRLSREGWKKRCCQV